jgi:hypothetical protein
MRFNASEYGHDVASILALDGDGHKLRPLVITGCTSAEARRRVQNARAQALFPVSRAPEAAHSGLFLYFGCFDEAHSIAQEIHATEGSFWHGILHRQEPDAGNASYWFRRVSSHPVFPALRDVAEAILAQYPATGFDVGARWEPLAFIDFCEQARRSPGSEADQAAMEIQRAEWQLLFDYCARQPA